MTVRDFLDTELAKYESWEELPEVLMNLLGPTDERDKKDAFIKIKKGVGQTTILKFLGGGWGQWRIQ